MSRRLSQVEGDPEADKCDCHYQAGEYCDSDTMAWPYSPGIYSN